MYPYFHPGWSPFARSAQGHQQGFPKWFSILFLLFLAWRHLLSLSRGVHYLLNIGTHGGTNCEIFFGRGWWATGDGQPVDFISSWTGL